jgi:hypothetical protein
VEVGEGRPGRAAGRQYRFIVIEVSELVKKNPA